MSGDAMKEATMDLATATDVARGLYAALATGDREALDGFLHERFEGVTTAGLPGGLGGRFEGPDAMKRDFWRAVGNAYEVAAEPEEFRLLEDGGLLVLGRYRGWARESRRELDASFAHVLDFEGERVRRLRQVTDTQRWHEAFDEDEAAAEDQEPLLYDVDDLGVATLHLNRPGAGNAFNQRLAIAFDDATAAATRDPRVRAILLTAQGPVFNVGGDVGVFATAPEGRLGATLSEMTDRFHAGIARLAECDAPVVCAVRGAAAGGGLGLVCVADLVIAGDDSRYVVGYPGLGLTADGGVTWFLPRLVGLRRAQQFFLGGGAWSAQEALAAGLITQVVSDDEVDDVARSEARRLAAGPTAAFGHVRRLLRDSGSTGLRQHLAAEQQALADVADGPDAREGIAAFAAKRSPVFPRP